MPPNDDRLLAQQHLGGDPQAFGALVDRYQHRVLNFIHRTVDDRKRSERLAQEVFVRAFRQLPQFDPGEHFGTWLYTIASQLATNELRSRTTGPARLRRSLGLIAGQVSGAFRGVEQTVKPASRTRSIERRSTLGRPTQ